jgi:hypothetical protein
MANEPTRDQNEKPSLATITHVGAEAVNLVLDRLPVHGGGRTNLFAAGNHRVLRATGLGHHQVG